jgi:hypothetical protein
VARALVQLNPAMAFVYVSGQGTDATEQGRVMWARVKGRTMLAAARLPQDRAVLEAPEIARLARS